MLAILATHPIQYQVPIWQQLAERGSVPFEVWYLTAHGVKPSLDPQFGKVFSWDMDLLGGYPHRFPRDPVPPQLGGFWEVRLPGDFRDRLNSGRITALLVAGWNVRACWEAVYLAHWAGVKIWMRGDSNDLKLDTGAKRLIKRWLLGSLLRRVNSFLCVGEANRRLYRSYGVSENRLFSGPHCVDNQRFAAQARQYTPDRQALRQAWGISDNAYCLLFVGKFIPKKHPLDLVAAAHRLVMLDPDRSYHLLFVGAGELGDELRRRCRVVHDAESSVLADTANTSSGPRASFAGFLNQTEISKAYVAADGLVLPSDPGETWGLVVNEALASGLPAVVSAACGSAEDLVVPLDPRLRFPLGDIEALAAAIRHLADHPVPAAAMAEHIARYDFSATVDTLETLWRTTVGS